MQSGRGLSPCPYVFMKHPSGGSLMRPAQHGSLAPKHQRTHTKGRHTVTHAHTYTEVTQIVTKSTFCAEICQRCSANLFPLMEEFLNIPVFSLHVYAFGVLKSHLNNEQKPQQIWQAGTRDSPWMLLRKTNPFSLCKTYLGSWSRVGGAMEYTCPEAAERCASFRTIITSNYSIITHVSTLDFACSSMGRRN